MIEKIQILRGAERIRLRPAVIFGSTDIRGVQVMIEMLLRIMAREGVDGHSSRLTITQYPDGSLELQDHGRGFYLGETLDSTLWQQIFCDLHPHSPYAPRERELPSLSEKGNLREGDRYPADREDTFWLSAAQCVCAYMDVRVCRDGLLRQLRFEKGEPVGGMTWELWNGETGTTLRFLPDPEIFSQVVPEDAWLRQQAQMLAESCPAQQIRLRII